MCTPRAGEMEVLRRLPETARIGVGVVNQKRPAMEGIEEVAAKVEHAVDLFGLERVLLHPDCGFATFADNPICSHSNANAKLAVIAQAAERFRT
jgi:5-methyltetrahydropteroyltriglutamate--homocysteine methyltransferase